MAYDQELADALAETANLRRWIAATKPLSAAMAVTASDVQKLQAALADMIDLAETISPYALGDNSKKRIADAKLLAGRQGTRGDRCR